MKRKEEMSHINAADTLRAWRESAPYWEEHRDTHRNMFAPLTQALIEEAGIFPGQAVLGVAGGPGEPSLTIAEIVGLAGSVMCTDAVAEMVAAAESSAQRLGIRNISFRPCTADSLPFQNHPFYRAIIPFSAIFFSYPLFSFL